MYVKLGVHTGATGKSSNGSATKPTTSPSKSEEERGDLRKKKPRATTWAGVSA
jgi:hypothetical protein